MASFLAAVLTGSICRISNMDPVLLTMHWLLPFHVDSDLIYVDAETFSSLAIAQPAGRGFSILKKIPPRTQHHRAQAPRWVPTIMDLSRQMSFESGHSREANASMW